MKLLEHLILRVGSITIQEVNYLGTFPSFYSDLNSIIQSFLNLKMERQNVF